MKRRLTVFNQISLDGYFCGENGDLSWAHHNSNDKEWNEFVGGNATGGVFLKFYINKLFRTYIQFPKNPDPIAITYR